MKKGVIYKEVALPAVILTAICVAVTGLLALTYAVTKDPIAAAEAKQKTELMAVILPADEYIDIDGEDAALAVRGGKLIGCVVTTSAMGYDGEIQVMTGILMTGDICGVRILSMSETPGVGTKTGSEKFLGQFVTMSPDEISPGDIPSDPWSAVDDFAVGGRIDGVSGATVSSKAVTAAVNDALAIFTRLSGEGKLSLPGSGLTGTDLSDSDLPDSSGEEVNDIG